MTVIAPLLQGGEGHGDDDNAAIAADGCWVLADKRPQHEAAPR